MASDVCKHCTDAACLEVCPTGALFRTEFGTVVVQAGRLQRVRLLRAGLPIRRDRPARGRRTGVEVHALLRPPKGRHGAGVREGMSRPTRSSSVSSADLRERAEHRLADLQQAGQEKAQLYLADGDDGVGGAGAFFLLLDEPEVYGLPPDPVDTRRDLASIWAAAGVAAVALGVGIGGRRVRQDKRPERCQQLSRAAHPQSSRRGRGRSRATSTSGGWPVPPRASRTCQSSAETRCWRAAPGRPRCSGSA